jgi:hypothetical protein
MRSLGLSLVAIVSFCLSSVGWGDQAEILRKDLRGHAPPEIVGEKDQWMGKSAPLTVAELKGKVIWLQFNF